MVCSFACNLCFPKKFLLSAFFGDLKLELSNKDTKELRTLSLFKSQSFLRPFRFFSFVWTCQVTNLTHKGLTCTFTSIYF